ncbi:GspE/PulE family protein [Methylotenera sp.]|uniref:GspE/PulE family protein n=3 Tax=Methylotenera sp. TaxID=2051956 RepID=UPI00272F0C58|nr:type II/IV secretion system protein [Methylotenera sp.]MDP2071244.1 ATPase, T2SS/T4P/T4SS family [Methylotenera sp.]MDP2231542.1 ATPase, T2SS/T4P/T4SS family [Methylotenera sp.]MDP3005161.1 ATPase, T2SS/T4P/T4SS family [Methylotenera sp.]MDP3141745.1 ATPase, T2SS/T4P/T4SS family [Methylotenera sp.]
MARPEKIRLGEILVQQNLITADDLDKSLEEQKRTGRKLGRIFVDKGYVTELQISEALARQLKVPFIDLQLFNTKPEIINKLPEAQARRLRCAVLADKGNSYLVGMVDPTDLFAYDELVRLLHKDIELAVIQEGALLQLIDRSYRRTDEISNLALELGQDLGDTAIDFAALGMGGSAEEAPVVKLLQTIFEDAVQVRASDIHIEPQEHKLHIRFRIDGVMHLQTEADLKIASALALRLKLMSGLDISEKRLPQDGRFAVKVKQQPVDVRISSMPTQYGESVVMRLLIQNSSGFSLEKLGMPPDMLERFRKLIHRPSGMVLVTGPTGSGKTTTLYAALSELNSTSNKIITVEDPVEYRLNGINQVQVNDKIDLSFSRVLRSTLRQDPDIILVGEMRDQETAQIGLRAAMTGHLVLSTLHTNDAISTPIRMIDMGAPRYMVAMSILAVVAQRLLRLVCEGCAETYTPEPFERAWLQHELGDNVDQHRYVHGKGCSICNGTGYQGRMGVYELLEMNNELIDGASHHDPNHFIKLARQHMAGKTLRKSAVDLVIEKRTTIAEAMRISNQFED